MAPKRPRPSHRRPPAPPVAQLFSQALALHQQGDLDKAAGLYHKLLVRQPRHADASNNLAIILQQQGRLAQAINLYRRCLRQRPTHLEARKNLAMAYKESGLFQQALSVAGKVLADQPNDPDMLCCRATALLGTGDARSAWRTITRLLRRDDTGPDPLVIAADILVARNRKAAAGRLYTRALALAPDHLPARLNYAHLLKASHHSQQALAQVEHILRDHPDLPPALALLAEIKLDQGEPTIGVNLLRKTIQADVPAPARHSCLIAAANYDPSLDQQQLLDMARSWAQTYIQTGKRGGGSHPRRRPPLRIGYLSPDFRNHPVSYFLEPVLAAHSHSRVSTYCYSASPHADAVSDRLRSLAGHWRAISSLSDQQVCDQIRRDRIDVLVDLAGHTVGNRLPVFARMPAPIQISWLGYMNTTGLPAIGYRLSDAITDPLPSSAAHYTETILHLPDAFFCWRPPPDMPAVTALPARTSGSITFGSVNNIRKISRPVIQLWSQILRQLEDSRLLLLAPQLHDPSIQEQYRQWFRDSGVKDRQLLFQAGVSLDKYYQLLQKIDLALDPFPLNGHTVSCQLLWMGVPIITLRGTRTGGRMGATILTNLGLQEYCVAEAKQDYVQKAVELASTTDLLTELRQGLRHRMRQSPLLDCPKFTDNLEQIYLRLAGR